MKITALERTYPFVRHFRIASQIYDDAPVVEVTVQHDGFVGRGEAAGVDYRGETCATMLAQIAGLAAQFDPAAVPGRDWLLQALPPGGARNAVDCALWDIEAKRAGRRAHELAGLPDHDLTTVITIGIDTPEVMARDAAAFGPGALIKIKLGQQGDAERLRAVRAAAPDAQLFVDANQGWSYDEFLALEDDLLGSGVWLIEQPLPAADDERLRDYRGPLLLCADESCQDRASLPALVGKYHFINIKLDKTGGLTEALALADEAAALSFRLMVGCMGGSSLGIAPGLIVGQRCEVIDLDCPLQLKQDIDFGLAYAGHRVGRSSPMLWG